MTATPFNLVLLYCTEQNTRQVISLGEEEAFSKYDRTMFLSHTTIKKPTTIHLGKLNESEKTCFFSP